MSRQIGVTRILHHVAVGIIVDASQRVLISKRPNHKIKGGFWEFPGGKIEQNETPEQGLTRELLEEVGIKVLNSKLLMQYQYDYSEHSAQLEVFVVFEFEGEAQSLEGQEIKWISVEEFSNYHFPEANQQMIKRYLNEIHLKSLGN